MFIDKYPSNKKNTLIIKKKLYNKISSFIAIFTNILKVLLVVFIIRIFFLETFKINSCSMMPTLLVGDFIIVEKISYWIKNPISYTKRGDIVVFKYPENNKLYYIKRVVGLPGDRISYNPITKQLKVKSIVKRYQDYYLPIIYSDFIKSNVDSGILIEKRKESLVGIVHEIITVPSKHDIVEIYYNQYTKNKFYEWLVPQGEYFMMGDNRDNSYDSRYWGFVNKKNIIGKAKIICMSFNKQDGILLNSIRLRRIGYCF